MDVKNCPCSWPHTLEFRKLFPEAKTPTRQTKTSAGLDIYTPEFENSVWNIMPKDQVLIDTGIVFNFPLFEDGRMQFAAVLKDKSSVAYEKGLNVKAGVIDPDFRGSVKLLLRNESDIPVTVRGGEKIVQMLFTPVWCPRMKSLSTILEEETDSINCFH